MTPEIQQTLAHNIGHVAALVGYGIAGLMLMMAIMYRLFAGGR